MLMTLITPPRRGEAAGACTLPVRCRIFGPGQEDWNRGVRSLRRVGLQEGSLTRLGDGGVCIRDLPGADLNLAAAEVAHIRDHGLRISAGSLEITIHAEDFRKALDALPPSGAVLLFGRKPVGR